MTRGMYMKPVAETVTRRVVARSRPRRSPSKTVAVVVPASQRARLLPDEEISLRHLRRHLGHYDKYVVTPRGNDLRLDGFHSLKFSPKFFGSMPAYNHMMYVREFYEAFQDYKYILVYHFDALVFSDDLLTWCETDVDYIGAPWMPSPELPWVKEPAVGNGGFALMKIESILKVLDNRYQTEPLSYWKDVASRNLSRFLPQVDLTAPHHGGALRGIWRRVQYTEPNRVLNDIFWSQYAQKYLSDFRIPDWTVALRFAFESAPRKCYELNGRRLPFGCHAWGRYDRGFWEPYLLPADETCARAAIQ